MANRVLVPSMYIRSWECSGLKICRRVLIHKNYILRNLHAYGITIAGEGIAVTVKVITGFAIFQE